MAHTNQAVLFAQAFESSPAAGFANALVCRYFGSRDLDQFTTAAQTQPQKSPRPLVLTAQRSVLAHDLAGAVGHHVRRNAIGDYVALGLHASPPCDCSPSAGKGHKIGNAHLRWAIGEVACLMLRELPAAQVFVARLEKQHGKAKAISILAARIRRTAWLMLKRKEAFDATQFLK